ncbi:MAG: aminopeptidase, partial [Clostridia bacterium]|nr:aminopeptidase [Clostridia bacterium]
LIDLAKNNGIDYAVDIYPYYGSDVGAMWTAGHDVPGALIGTGVHASHGMERTHFDGIANTIKLILLYITQTK